MCTTLTRKEVRRLAERAISLTLIKCGVDDCTDEIIRFRAISRTSKVFACGVMCAYDKEGAVVVNCPVRQAGDWQDLTIPSSVAKSLALAWDNVTSYLGCDLIRVD